MKPAAAWAVVAALAAATALALVLPPLPLLAFAVVAVAGLRRGRAGFLLFATTTVALNALLLGLLVHGEPVWSWRGLELGRIGLERGLFGGLRLVAVTGANLALLGRVGMERVLDGLRLPAHATAFLAAVLIAAHDLGRDAQRLAQARRLDGAWPTGRVRRLVAGAALLAPLLVVAVRRGLVRRDALRLAGHDTPPRFAALVAITALAVASRMAFIALPNVKPTYAVVFLGGLLFGPAVGSLAGLLSMAFTDLLLTGLAVAPFANAPAMALVGAMGGLLRGWSRAPRSAVVAAAAVCGVLGTIVFSLSADLLSWAIIPEYRTTPGTLVPLLLLGLSFNALPAVVNAVLFAATVGPVERAARAAGLTSGAAREVAREA